MSNQTLPSTAKTDVSESVASSLYRDAGDWARHFSAVRLCIGVTMVLSGAIATMTLEESSLAAAVAKWVWATGLFTFGYFSHLVVKMQNRQRQIRCEQMRVQATWKVQSLLSDIPLWIVLLFSAALLGWNLTR